MWFVLNCVSRSYQYELLVALLKVEVKGQPKEIRSSVVSTPKFQVEIGTHIRLILLNSLRSVVHNGDALFELSEISLRESSFSSVPFRQATSYQWAPVD